MTDKKAPDAAVVEKAQGKEAAGDDLTQREQAALAAQAAIDAERGYKVIDWKGLPHYQSEDGHTSQSESEIIRHVAERRVAERRVNAASPVIMGH